MYSLPGLVVQRHGPSRYPQKIDMLTPLSHPDGRRLRGFLAEAGYAHEPFQRNPALRELPHGTGSLAFMLEHTREGTPLNILLRWFLLGVAQPGEFVAPHIPEPLLAMMTSCGLLACRDSMLSPSVMLTPCDEYMFAADCAARMRSAHADDLVLWPNPTTRLLQNFSTRRHAASMLDLGAGCGILGIIAASHCDRVVCTDLNPRAAEFIAFNAALNGVSNIEWRIGDTFEPVRGETFDLILANPPFFVTPGSENLYCENSMELDQYCRRVIREAPAHLTEGGYFQAIMEWVQVGGESWQQRLAEWLDGNGCDAWIMRKYIRDGVGYAQERIKDNWPAEQHAAKLAEWMDYYRQRGVEEVQGGLLAMRRRAGQNWVRMEDLGPDPTGPFGGVVEETFATQDVLSASSDDEALLDTRPRLSPEARMEQTFAVSEGKWSRTGSRMLLASELPAALPVERDVAEFLAGCNGTRTLRELAAGLSARAGAPLDRVAQECCSIIRKLAQRRFVSFS